MSDLRPPGFEPRRRTDLRDELVARARLWLPEWRPRRDGAKFATALFEIAARLTAEVTERLDKIPEKTFRGFLHWLGVRGQAGRAGRLPIVFRMAAGAEPVLAAAPVQAQALDVDPPVTFETEQDLMIVPGTLATLVGADPANDTFSLPPQGFSALDAPKAVPHEWRVKAPASVGATQIQLEPEQGLDELPTLFHARTNQHYRVIKAEGGIVTIEPPLGTIEPKPGVEPVAPSGLEIDERLTRVTTFGAFGLEQRNRQEHALYIGSESLLNLKTEARIEIVNGTLIPREVQWSYWGKVEGGGTVADWRALSPPPPEGPLTLNKPAGDVEIREIGGQKSRWFRAVMPSGAGLEAIDVSQLKLMVNCADGETRRCPLDPGDPRSTVAIDAIANTTPVVLDTTFYPLGREPRLFDAFYLASPEAFSKKHAFVEICFQRPDGTSAAFTAARIGWTDPTAVMLFGVGADMLLHRLRLDPDPARPVMRLAPVRPPFSENGNAPFRAPTTSLNPHGRLTTVSREETADVVVAVTAGLEVWLWRQSKDPVRSRWFRGGTIADARDGQTPVLDPARRPSVILMRDGDGLRMVGLRDGVLYEARLNKGWEDAPEAPAWRRLDVVESAPGRMTNTNWLRIAAVTGLEDRMQGADVRHGWLAIDSEGIALFTNGSVRRLTRIGKVATDVMPLALKIGNEPDEILIVVQQEVTITQEPRESAPTREHLVSAWRVTNRVTNIAFTDRLRVIDSFDWQRTTRGDLAIVFTVDREEEGRALAAWFPIRGEEDGGELMPAFVSSPLALLHGAPAFVNGTIVASGPHAEIIVVPFNVDRLRAVEVPSSALDEAWLIAGSEAPFAIGDFVVLTDVGGEQLVHEVAQEAMASGSHRVYLPAPEIDADVHETAAIFTPIADGTFDGTLKKTTELELSDDDAVAAEGGFLVIEDDDEPVSQHEIESIKTVMGQPRRAVLVPPAPVTGDVTYVHVTRRPSRTIARHPSLKLSTLAPEVIEQMRAADLYFDDAEPVQRVAWIHPPTNLPTHALLAHEWETAPAGNGTIAFAINAMFSAAQILAEPKTGTAELSWEYWDGSAWWTIKGLVDGTDNFQSTGQVTFCVPDTLQPTDVVGRTSHWIRARLVAGDYGRESVSIKSVTDTTQNPPVTTQTVERSLAGIMAPQIASIDLRYSVCCATAPDRVLTKDGGAIRDQSEANRTEGAFVELFVPLAETIRRAGGLTPDAAAASARALYLGFDTELKGGPISILFLVDEGDHDGAYPLQLEVLRGNRFEAVIAQDGTRGLNETGVVTFHLSAPPTQTSLFGRLQHWLRLRPNPRFDAANWRPVIRAAYLNATWTRAAETQFNESLGSSDGSPDQRVLLTRTPVLENSLKLRVLEPLGEEEIAELRRTDPDVVLDRLNERPGPWVLWREVVDPSDEPAGARVYAFDDETGEITFGDGVHGRIPPAGQNVIVAERYQRGGGDRANQVKAWSQINLITPLQGVERAATPEGAAGGSDPQDADTALRFAPANLFMRDRALTLRDLEMLALQFSPDVAQARAVPGGSSVRLVVVMRGLDPKPSRLVQRELADYLLHRAPPSLAEPGALEIVAPEVVPLRVMLRLAITAIEHSGAVAQDAAQRIAALLDPARGGLDRAGWRLGDVPSDVDIVAALDGTPNLAGILDVTRSTLAAGGALEPMPAAVRPTQLVQLMAEGVRVELELADLESVA